jgi:hypothetical protein
MSFEPHPFPERIVEYRMPSLRQVNADEQVSTIANPMLSVGVQLIDKDGNGLKLYRPEKFVVVAIGDGNEPERETFRLNTRSARGIAKRMIEMCDAIEREEARVVNIPSRLHHADVPGDILP